MALKSTACMPDSTIPLSRGLSTTEVEKRRKQYGENIIAKRKKLRPIEVFLKKFFSPLSIILLVASLLSILVGQRTDALIIMSIVAISAVLDFWNSHKSDVAMERLAARVAVTATVMRSGSSKEVFTKDLVPGDIVCLSAGDVVPADGVVLEASDFFINQSALTGESFPVEKEPLSAGKRRAQSPLNEPHQVFMGSSVVTGYAIIEVAAIGAKTRFGLIAERLAAHAGENDFERGIRRFSFFILRVTFILVLFVFFVNSLMHKGLFESFFFALAIAIGLTPELLPVVISLALSHGSLRMANKEVIVKNLTTIQNFGSMTVLCTDKTGTLTEDKIQLVKYVDAFGNVSESVLQQAYLTSEFHTGVRNPLDEAIKEFRHLSLHKLHKVDEIPFDFTRRRSSVVVADVNDKRWLITKGAPEDILPLSTTYRLVSDTDRHDLLDETAREKINAQFVALSQDGFRVLAIAMKEVHSGKKIYDTSEEHRLTFLGFVAFYDPPKHTVTASVKELAALGVEIKIITGDNELLTQKICRDIHLPLLGVVTGAEIDTLSEEALERLAARTTIFARVNPVQKERIILSLKRTKGAVGYLGDGINDAPALKAADVGISVDNAVDVAKETADIILLRKSLHVLKDGVIEGRKTFQNTTKYILMGISANFGNMVSVTGLSLFLPFFPMLPSQILLNNLLYDVAQFTLPTDQVDAEDIQKPLHWDMRFIRRYMLVFGLVSSLFDFLTFAGLWRLFHPIVAQFQAAWFVESLVTQLLVIFVIRTRKLPFLQSRPSRPLFWSTIAIAAIAAYLPFSPAASLLHFARLSAGMVVGVFFLVLTYLITVQICKMIFYRHLIRDITG